MPQRPFVECSPGRKVIFVAYGLLASLALLLFVLMPVLVLFTPGIAFLGWLCGNWRTCKSSWKVGATLLLLAVMAFGFMGQIVRTNSRRPDRYLIPEGYTGWIIVEYQVKGAPPLPREDGRDLFRIRGNGRLQTSSSLEDGWASDDYYYSGPAGRSELKNTAWGEGGMIWAGATGGGSIGVGDASGKQRTIHTPPTQTFYVGTEKQFQTAGAEPHSEAMRKVIEKS